MWDFSKADGEGEEVRGNWEVEGDTYVPSYIWSKSESSESTIFCRSWGSLERGRGLSVDGLFCEEESLELLVLAIMGMELVCEALMVDYLPARLGWRLEGESCKLWVQRRRTECSYGRFRCFGQSAVFNQARFPPAVSAHQS